MYEEHSEPIGTEEGKVEEPHWEEPETLGIVQTNEVSIIILHVESVALSNHSNPRHHSVQRTVTSIPPHTQSGTLGRSMEDEMRLPYFRGDGSQDVNQH
jgi:hypothetical protein